LASVVTPYSAMTRAEKLSFGRKRNSQGLPSWVSTGYAFGTSGAKALTEALGKAGATVALDQGYTNQSQESWRSWRAKMPRSFSKVKYEPITSAPDWRIASTTGSTA
jgi:hypothetical protein